MKGSHEKLFYPNGITMNNKCECFKLEANWTFCPLFRRDRRSCWGCVWGIDLMGHDEGGGSEGGREGAVVGQALHGLRYTKRSLMSWKIEKKKKFPKNFSKSRCHTKRRAGAAPHARPSFGMTPTQDIRDLFTWRYLHAMQAGRQEGAAYCFLQSTEGKEGIHMCIDMCLSSISLKLV